MKLGSVLGAGLLSRGRRAPGITPAHRAVAWQCASLLLDYPDADLGDRLALVTREAAALPEALGEPLARCAALLGEVPVGELQVAYVETFDSRRRHNLFLTYFAHGDTRKRGMALLRFKQTYLMAGVELDESGEAGAELPDHLCVVLEFAAGVDHDAGRQLMIDHRAGLELLRLGLVETESRWAGAVQAVTATLPVLDADDMDAVRRMAAEGPPEEEVGMSPYEKPMFDPGAAPPTGSGPVQLPMPTLRPSSVGGR